eukprot:2580866-Pyramimonas_sp.AAC.1
MDLVFVVKLFVAVLTGLPVQGDRNGVNLGRSIPTVWDGGDHAARLVHDLRPAGWASGRRDGVRGYRAGTHRFWGLSNPR